MTTETVRRNVHRIHIHLVFDSTWPTHIYGLLDKNDLFTSIGSSSIHTNIASKLNTVWVVYPYEQHHFHRSSCLQCQVVGLWRNVIQFTIISHNTLPAWDFRRKRLTWSTADWPTLKSEIRCDEVRTVQENWNLASYRIIVDMPSQENQQRNTFIPRSAALVFYYYRHQCGKRNTIHIRNLRSELWLEHLYSGVASENH